MSRGLSTLNESHVNGVHVTEVALAKLEFDTPVYVHTGVGSITYDGNTYTGVGSLGGISEIKESESLGPLAIELSIDGTNSSYITEVLDSGNYGDVVTIYVGYRADDGTLIDNPRTEWKGWYESASISVGEQSVGVITCQHDLAILGEKNGDRYSDEDQQDKYSGDLAFEYAADAVGVKLLWAGGGIGGRGGYSEPDPPARGMQEA